MGRGAGETRGQWATPRARLRSQLCTFTAGPRAPRHARTLVTPDAPLRTVPPAPSAGARRSGRAASTRLRPTAPSATSRWGQRAPASWPRWARASRRCRRARAPTRAPSALQRAALRIQGGRAHCQHDLSAASCAHWYRLQALPRRHQPRGRPQNNTSYHPLLQIGQHVACNGAAAFAEFGVVKAPMCVPVTRASPEAVALVLSGVTAAAALDATAGVTAGQTVAVTAAAGGTGHFAVQIAKLAGARVIAVTGSPAKVSALERLGADAVICHATQVTGGRASWAGAVLLPPRASRRSWGGPPAR